MPTLLKLPDLVCPACGTRMDGHSPITESAKRPIHKGMLLVCANCTTFCILGDSVLERLTVRQFRALDKETQKLLGITKFKLEEYKARN